MESAGSAPRPLSPARALQSTWSAPVRGRTAHPVLGEGFLPALGHPILWGSGFFPVCDIWGIFLQVLDLFLLEVCASGRGLLVEPPSALSGEEKTWSWLQKTGVPCRKGCRRVSAGSRGCPCGLRGRGARGWRPAWFPRGFPMGH